MASGNYNYALNKSVTTSSYILPYIPERAVNGTLSGPADRWTSGFWKFEDEKLLYKVDFGASYYISRYVIKSVCELPTGSSDKWPDNYENISVAVVYSTDNENWVELGEYTSIENTIDREFNSVSYVLIPGYTDETEYKYYYTVTITKAGDFTELECNALINGLKFGVTPYAQSGDRYIEITGIIDNGGTAHSGNCLHCPIMLKDNNAKSKKPQA
ncbi:hypothetical protein [Anaerotignum sp.]|uniref:hypothetical protein n=1 Tax=Anaerotignum sp. TaxID=2039241 RepID=UPI00289853FA|nr:hypothetical protein [Anaerotignum sp.]